MKNLYLKIAGIINLHIAFLHIIGGQLSLVNPLLKSGLKAQTEAGLVSVYHIVTVLLFATSYIILKHAFTTVQSKDSSVLSFIGWLYVLISVPSVVLCMWYGLLVPQWIILSPIGILVLIRKQNQ